MTSHDTYCKPAVPAFLSITLLLLTAGKTPAVQIRHNVPPGIQQASDQGPANPDEEVNLTLHLKMADRAAFDAAVEQLYDRASVSYHKWMTDADLQKYAPTADQIAAVKREVAKHGLTVISSDPLGFPSGFAEPQPI
jgi:subtilase family serine protease